MPRAEENQTIAKGQPYGARIQQEQATAALAAPQAGVQPPAQQIPGFSERELLTAALRPTDRPEEPIQAGLQERINDQIAEAREWFPLLYELASQPYASQAIRDLADRARRFDG